MGRQFLMQRRKPREWMLLISLVGLLLPFSGPVYGLNNHPTRTWHIPPHLSRCAADFDSHSPALALIQVPNPITLKLKRYAIPDDVEFLSRLESVSDGANRTRLLQKSRALFRRGHEVFRFYRIDHSYPNVDY